jgi:hypothetical protein
MVEIIHTRADGTMAHGTTRGDGSAPILKRAGFRWAPSLKTWIVQQSRDRAVKSWIVDAAAEGLRAAGFEVTVSIDDTPRAFAEAEAERAERISERADRLEGRAGRATSEAEARYAAARREADLIPPGQPILVGHHSERGHRAALKRIDNNMRRSIEADRAATHYERAAKVAGQYTARRESLPTTLRRIAKLEAEERKTRRDMQPCPTSARKAKAGNEGRTFTCPRCYNEQTIGADLLVPDHGRRISQATADQRLAELADELAYWRKVVADQEEDGAKVWGPADFRPGDRVRYWGGWREVLKVNAKSLTVPSGYSWDERLPYDEVRGRRAAGDPGGQVEHVDQEDDGPADECDGADR